jgi:hypothetical protein
MRSFWGRLPTLVWIAGAAATVGAMLAALRG